MSHVPTGRMPARPRASVYCSTCVTRYRRVWRVRGYGWGTCRKHFCPQSVLPKGRR